MATKRRYTKSMSSDIASPIQLTPGRLTRSGKIVNSTDSISKVSSPIPLLNCLIKNKRGSRSPKVLTIQSEPRLNLSAPVKENRKRPRTRIQSLDKYEIGHASSILNDDSVLPIKSSTRAKKPGAALMPNDIVNHEIINTAKESVKNSTKLDKLKEGSDLIINKVDSEKTNQKKRKIDQLNKSFPVENVNIQTKSQFKICNVSSLFDEVKRTVMNDSLAISAEMDEQSLTTEKIEYLHNLDIISPNCRKVQLRRTSKIIAIRAKPGKIMKTKLLHPQLKSSNTPSDDKLIMSKADVETSCIEIASSSKLKTTKSEQSSIQQEANLLDSSNMAGRGLVADNMSPSKPSEFVELRCTEKKNKSKPKTINSGQLKISDTPNRQSTSSIQGKPDKCTKVKLRSDVKSDMPSLIQEVADLTDDKIITSREEETAKEINVTQKGAKRGRKPGKKVKLHQEVKQSNMIMTLQDLSNNETNTRTKDKKVEAANYTHKELKSEIKTGKKSKLDGIEKVQVLKSNKINTILKDEKDEPNPNCTRKKEGKEGKKVNKIKLHQEKNSSNPSSMIEQVQVLKSNKINTILKDEKDEPNPNCTRKKEGKEGKKVNKIKLHQEKNSSNPSSMIEQVQVLKSNKINTILKDEKDEPNPNCTRKKEGKEGKKVNKIKLHQEKNSSNPSSMIEQVQVVPSAKDKEVKPNQNCTQKKVKTVKNKKLQKLEPNCTREESSNMHKTSKKNACLYYIENLNNSKEPKIDCENDVKITRSRITSFNKRDTRSSLKPLLIRCDMNKNPKLAINNNLSGENVFPMNFDSNMLDTLGESHKLLKGVNRNIVYCDINNAIMTYKATDCQDETDSTRENVQYSPDKVNRGLQQIIRGSTRNVLSPETSKERYGGSNTNNSLVEQLNPVDNIVASKSIHSGSDSKLFAKCVVSTEKLTDNTVALNSTHIGSDFKLLAKCVVSTEKLTNSTVALNSPHSGSDFKLLAKCVVSTEKLTAKEINELTLFNNWHIPEECVNSEKEKNLLQSFGTQAMSMGTSPKQKQSTLVKYIEITSNYKNTPVQESTLQRMISENTIQQNVENKVVNRNTDNLNDFTKSTLSNATVGSLGIAVFDAQHKSNTKSAAIKAQQRLNRKSQYIEMVGPKCNIQVKSDNTNTQADKLMSLEPLLKPVTSVKVPSNCDNVRQTIEEVVRKYSESVENDKSSVADVGDLPAQSYTYITDSKGIVKKCNVETLTEYITKLQKKIEKQKKNRKEAKTEKEDKSDMEVETAKRVKPEAEQKVTAETEQNVTVETVKKVKSNNAKKVKREPQQIVTTSILEALLNQSVKSKVKPKQQKTVKNNADVAYAIKYMEDCKITLKVVNEAANGTSSDVISEENIHKHFEYPEQNKIQMLHTDNKMTSTKDKCRKKSEKAATKTVNNKPKGCKNPVIYDSKYGVKDKNEDISNKNKNCKNMSKTKNSKKKISDKPKPKYGTNKTLRKIFECSLPSKDKLRYNGKAIGKGKHANNTSTLNIAEDNRASHINSKAPDPQNKLPNFKCSDSLKESIVRLNTYNNISKSNLTKKKYPTAGSEKSKQHPDIESQYLYNTTNDNHTKLSPKSTIAENKKCTSLVSIGCLNKENSGDDAHKNVANKEFTILSIDGENICSNSLDVNRVKTNPLLAVDHKNKESPLLISKLPVHHNDTNAEMSSTGADDMMTHKQSLTLEKGLYRSLPSLIDECNDNSTMDLADKKHLASDKPVLSKIDSNKVESVSSFMHQSFFTSNAGQHTLNQNGYISDVLSRPKSFPANTNVQISKTCRTQKPAITSKKPTNDIDMLNTTSTPLMLTKPASKLPIIEKCETVNVNISEVIKTMPAANAASVSLFCDNVNSEKNALIIDRSSPNIGSKDAYTWPVACESLNTPFKMNPDILPQFSPVSNISFDMGFETEFELPNPGSTEKKLDDSSTAPWSLNYIDRISFGDLKNTTNEIEEDDNFVHISYETPHSSNYYNTNNTDSNDSIVIDNKSKPNSPQKSHHIKLKRDSVDLECIPKSNTRKRSWSSHKASTVNLNKSNESDEGPPSKLPLLNSNLNNMTGIGHNINTTQNEISSNQMQKSDLFENYGVEQANSAGNIEMYITKLNVGNKPSLLSEMKSWEQKKNPFEGSFNINPFNTNSLWDREHSQRVDISPSGTTKVQSMQNVDILNANENQENVIFKKPTEISGMIRYCNPSPAKFTAPYPCRSVVNNRVLNRPDRSFTNSQEYDDDDNDDVLSISAESIAGFFEDALSQNNTDSPSVIEENINRGGETPLDTIDSFDANMPTSVPSKAADKSATSVTSDDTVTPHQQLPDGPGPKLIIIDGLQRLPSDVLSQARIAMCCHEFCIGFNFGICKVDGNTRCKYQHRYLDIMKVKQKMQGDLTCALHFYIVIRTNSFLFNRLFETFVCEFSSHNSYNHLIHMAKDNEANNMPSDNNFTANFHVLIRCLKAEPFNCDVPFICRLLHLNGLTSSCMINQYIFLLSSEQVLTKNITLINKFLKFKNYSFDDVIHVFFENCVTFKDVTFIDYVFKVVLKSTSDQALLRVNKYLVEEMICTLQSLDKTFYEDTLRDRMNSVLTSRASNANNTNMHTSEDPHQRSKLPLVRASSFTNVSRGGPAPGYNENPNYNSSNYRRRQSVDQNQMANRSNNLWNEKIQKPPPLVHNFHRSEFGHGWNNHRSYGDGQETNSWGPVRQGQYSNNNSSFPPPSQHSFNEGSGSGSANNYFPKPLPEIWDKGYVNNPYTGNTNRHSNYN